MADDGPSKNSEIRKRPGWGAERPQSATVSRKDITTIQILGDGSQGVVEKAIVPLFGICAVKYSRILDRNGPFIAEFERQVARELVAAQELAHHPNIVDFYGKVCDIVNGTEQVVGFFTELMEGGNLIQVMNKSNERMNLSSYFKIASRWSVQVARALAFCHSQKVIHRDVKPENMLLSKDHMTIKICDFGLARPDTDSSRNKTCNKGSILYIAPEVIGELGERQQYGASVDVYSFGMYLYTVYNRRLPFQELIGREDKTNPFDFKRDLMNGVRPECVLQLPSEIERVMKKCWCTDPKERPSMTKVVTYLEKYWKTKYPGDEF